MRYITAVFAVLCAVSASAQPIHGAPQGVTAYANASEWPFLSGQCHWRAPGDTPNPDSPLVPGIAHTHIEANLPIWAELGAGPITVPFKVVLFHTKGKFVLALGQIMTSFGEIAMSETVMDQPLPLVGDPNGIVSATGHITFDPSLAPVPLHGWFNTRIFGRTIYDDTEVLNNSLWIPYFSVLDPSQPEPAYGEGTMQLRAGCSVAGYTTEGFGEHVTEIRGTESIAHGYLPILAPFDTPQTIYPLTYNYKDLRTHPQYDLRLDANFHMGIEGSVLDSTQTAVQAGVATVATLDPVVIAASQTPMGVAPGKHRIATIWEQESGPEGSPGIAGGFPPNERLVSLLVFEVSIGPNPQPAPPVVTPPVIVPPVVVPPVVVPPVVVPPVPPVDLSGQYAISTPAGVYTFTCDALGRCQLTLVK